MLCLVVEPVQITGFGNVASIGIAKGLLRVGGNLQCEFVVVSGVPTSVCVRVDLLARRDAGNEHTTKRISPDHAHDSAGVKLNLRNQVSRRHPNAVMGLGGVFVTSKTSPNVRDFTVRAGGVFSAGSVRIPQLRVSAQSQGEWDNVDALSDWE